MQLGAKHVWLDSSIALKRGAENAKSLKLRERKGGPVSGRGAPPMPCQDVVAPCRTNGIERSLLSPLRLKICLPLLLILGAGAGHDQDGDAMGSGSCASSCKIV